MSTNKNKIVVNTIYVYLRLFLITIIGLITTRIVFNMLGVEGYGLYNVVGGVVVILNIFCTAMYTTTRRYINVEMGKVDGNVNRVFNLCLELHVKIAIIFFIIADLIGTVYIYNFLNVADEKFSDAVFVYNFSLFTSCLGLINVPYQSTLVAHENFKQMAIIDVLSKVILLLMVFLLSVYEGDMLRPYAIVTCLATILSLLFYTWSCYKKHSADVRLKKYKDKKLFKEILKFNNYTTLGAASYMVRAQGANLLINFFFNTIVNGAYAIAYQIESYLMMFISNLSTASSPQITQSYVKGDYQSSITLVTRINKISVLLMLFICFSAIIELPFLLNLWLGDATELMLLFSSLTIVSAFIRSLGEGIPPLVQASGKIKWFQISGSIFTLLDIPLAIIFYNLGFPAQTIIIIFCISSICARIVNMYLLYKILKFDVLLFLRKSYLSVIKVFPFLILYYFGYSKLEFTTNLSHMLGLFITVVISGIIIFFIGFDKTERSSIVNMIKTKLNIKI